MSWAGVVLFLSLLAMIYFVRESVAAWCSEEFKRDMARLREQRRMRKAARR